MAAKVTQLSSMMKFIVVNNKLHGVIPSSLSCWRRIATLDLGMNKLVGPALRAPRCPGLCPAAPSHHIAGIELLDAMFMFSVVRNHEKILPELF